MAIIYTYPKLTSPQGNELIVLSDVNNKNSTRIITLQSIVDLVPFCKNSVSGIQTPNGTYSSGDCTTASFTSSTLTISSTSSGVNFESGCGTNYVLKPVVCANSNCNPSLLSASWLFSCESYLSQYAGTGIPVTFTNNGEIVRHGFNEDPNNPTNCFYVEEWKPNVSSVTTCEACCDLPPIPLKCLYTKCTSSEDPNMPRTLVLDKVGDNCPPNVIYATDPSATYSCCYTFTGEVNDTVSTGYTYVAAVDCTTAPCVDDPTPELKTFTRCTNACNFGTMPEIVYGNQINGSFVVLTNGVSEACYTLDGTTVAEQTPNITQVSMNSGQDCSTAVTNGICKTQLIEYRACETSTSIQNVYFATDPGVGTGGVINVVFSNGTPSACYTNSGVLVCTSATQGIASTSIAQQGCEDAICESSSTKWIYTPCGITPCEGNPDLVSSDVDGIHALGSQAFWWNCCFYAVPERPVVTTLPDNAPLKTKVINAPSDISCEVFASLDKIRWNHCTDERFILTGCCDTGKTTILELGTVAYGFSNGEAGCYKIVDLNAVGDTTPCGDITIVDKCDNDACGGEPVVDGYGYRNCGDESFTPTSTNLSAYTTLEGSIRTWGNPAECLQFQKSSQYAGLGQPIVVPDDLTDFTNSEGDDCTCCENQDIKIYNRCSASAKTDCADMPTILSLPEGNNTILVEEDATGYLCCYTLGGNTCNAATPGYTVTNTIITEGGCANELCTGPPAQANFQFRQCGTENFTDTSSDLIAEAPLNNTIYTWRDVSGICYQIQQGGLGGGNPLNLSGATSFTNAEGVPCDCCNNFDQVLEYEKCDNRLGLPGCSSMDTTIQLVNQNFPNAPLTTVLVQDGSGNECCYTLQGQTCLSPTNGYGIVKSATNCSDPSCLPPTTSNDTLTQCINRDSLPGCPDMPLNIVLSGITANATVLVQDSDGKQCCYEWTGTTTNAVTPGLSFVSNKTDCSDPDCLDVPTTQLYGYEKCAASLSNGCQAMDDNVTLSLLPSEAATNLIIGFGGNECCYFNNEDPAGVATTGYSKTGEWSGSCTENFPVACQSQGPQTERFAYTKCSGVTTTECAAMDITVVLEGLSGTMNEPKVIRNLQTGNKCCYTPESITTAPVDTDFAIDASLLNCTDEALIEAGCKTGSGSEPDPGPGDPGGK